MQIDKWRALFVCFLTFGQRGCSGERPSNLGVRNGRLAECPRSPNCVSTQASGDRHRMNPVVYSGRTMEAQAQILNILAAMDRITIIENKPGYIYAEARSRIFGFVDDLEFYFAPEAQVIHFRSAARLGQGDMGVNRKRMKHIVSAFRQSLPAGERHM